MNIYGCYFTVGTFLSQNYKLIFANVDSKEVVAISGEVKTNYAYNKGSKSRYALADDYSESPLSFDIDIVTDDGSEISDANARTIEKTLFNKQKFFNLYVNDPANQETIDGVVKKLFLRCKMINPTKIQNGCKLYGYSVTIECDAGYAWQDAIEKYFNLSHSTAAATTTVTVTTDTDISDYTYPELLITIGNIGGDVSIVNVSDSDMRITSFEGLPSNAVITMNGETGYITHSYYTKFTDMNFARLLDGTNSVTVTGNVSTIKFKWNNRRYL